MLAIPGWLPVLPVPGSTIPAFPLAWGLGQLLLLVCIVVYFYFMITFIPSAFFSPGGEIRLCSCPACQPIRARLCHLCGEFLWQLRFLAMVRRTCHCPFPSHPCFPPCSRASTFPNASGHSQAQAQRKRPNPAHNRPFPAGKVFLGRHKKDF